MSYRELRTERLLLRRWREEDLAPFATLNADPETLVYFPATLHEVESEHLACRFDESFETDGFGTWAVELAATGTFIGAVGLGRVGSEIPCGPAVEAGWRLDRRSWGNGYATEAARAALDDGFATCGLFEVVAFTATINTPSRRVMERIGMTHDPLGDFDHPRVTEGPLMRHVLYRKTLLEKGSHGEG